jgi:hypothetical protein
MQSTDFRDKAGTAGWPIGEMQKQKPRRMARGFLAGSSWLLHIKQICIENQERIRRG